jgi:very-short-patch-repair endonuclease
VHESSGITIGTRSKNPTTRAIDIATRQGGVISRRQLLGAGVATARIGRWIAAGRLHPIHPGVYSMGHRAISDRGRLTAALLYSGLGSALSHGAGGWWLGLLDAKPKQIDVYAPGHAASRLDLAVHHPRAFNRFLYRGLPVVEVPTLLLQLASTLPAQRLRRTLARADYLKLLDPASVHAALGQGRHGSAALRQALSSHLPQLARAENDFEADFLLLCERFRLPMPEVNVRLGRFRPDMLWRDLKLIVELDGRDAHTKPAQVARDHDRDMTFRSWGYTVIRYTWAQVNFEPAAVAADLRAQMSRLRVARRS